MSIWNHRIYVKDYHLDLFALFSHHKKWPPAIGIISIPYRKPFFFRLSTGPLWDTPVKVLSNIEKIQFFSSSWSLDSRKCPRKSTERLPTYSHFLLPGSEMSDNRIPEASVPYACHPANVGRLHESHICRAGGIPLWFSRCRSHSRAAYCILQRHEAYLRSSDQCPCLFKYLFTVSHTLLSILPEFSPLFCQPTPTA